MSKVRPRLNLLQRHWQGVLKAAGLAGMLLGPLGWVLIQQADRLSVATLLAYGPRWVLLLVQVPLVVSAVLVWRRAWLPGLLSVLILVTLVMGFRMSFGSLWRSEPTAASLRLLTCNVQGSKGEAGLAAVLRQTSPDVVVIQEWPSEQPLKKVIPGGWFTCRKGRLVVASRWPVTEQGHLISKSNRWLVMALACRVKRPGGEFRVVGVHLPTARSGLEAVLHSRLAGLSELAAESRSRVGDSERLVDWLERSPGPKIVAGDFNAPPESAILRRSFRGWQNCFAAAGFGFGHTKFTRWFGARIDHILVDRSLRIRACWVCPDVGSDHRPIIAELVVAQKM